MKRQLNLHKHHNKGLNLLFNASAHYIPLERDLCFSAVVVGECVLFPSENFQITISIASFSSLSFLLSLVFFLGRPSVHQSMCEHENFN